MGSVSTIYNGVRTWLAGRALMDVAFSNRSTNGLQNKIITAKKDEIEGRLDSVESDVSKNDLGTGVEIALNTTSSVLYTFPSDGYLQLYSDSNGQCILRIFGDSGIELALGTAATSNQTDVDSLYVKKGMKCRCIILQGTNALKFFPLV